MIFWLLFISAPIHIKANDAQFECGDHGRFEYCIDGIPGCIVGCHCHPGYYFDTATKICEPNIKLMQAYRRQYSGGQPTRIAPLNSIEVLETSTFSSTHGHIDDHVEAIAKNADDLGDWLYNQFYKTVESQVINKTKEDLITRRSGNSPVLKTNKKRRKKERKGRKKQRQDDLRKKLLRITEDDSLFDSDTDADTETDTDTESQHSSSSEETHESKDKEHGHKKFVIVNKKPKPPLPSFIFLPNVDTPYYPPIGLPPPIVPMYPVIPVPPVVPPYSFPNISPDCNTAKVTTNPTISALLTSTPSFSTYNTLKVPTTKLMEKPQTNLTTMADIKTSTIEDAAALRKRKRKKEFIRRNKNDVLQRLRELVQHTPLKTVRKYNKKKPRIDDTKTLEIDSTDELVKTLSGQPINKDNVQLQSSDNINLQNEDATNFKYLSQLIHRIHVNDTKSKNPTKPSIQQIKSLIDSNKNNRILNQKTKLLPTAVLPSRRFNYKTNSQNKTSDSSFYTELGKQIANLIRGVNAKNDRQINIEIENIDKDAPSEPILSELNYAPHSYWERFARSPISYPQQYEDKMGNFNRYNELLYNIENKVQIVASTTLPLSLLEIENIVNVIERPISIVHKSIDSSQSENDHTTLKFNLWPTSRFDESNNILLNTSISNTRRRSLIFNNTYNHYPGIYFTSDLTRLPVKNRLKTWLISERFANSDNNSDGININLDNKSADDLQAKASIKNEDNIYIPRPREIKKMNSPQKNIVSKPIRRTPPEVAAISPMFEYNHKKFLNTNGQHPFYNNLIKYKLSSVDKPLNTPILRTAGPSYFHHELHHFDYWD